MQLGMEDLNYGWTVEMQVKALIHGLKVIELPVGYRARIGTSKVTGTMSGSVKAGMKMLYTVIALRLQKADTSSSGNCR
jgi:hypothetical protein